MLWRISGVRITRNAPWTLWRQRVKAKIGFFSPQLMCTGNAISPIRMSGNSQKQMRRLDGAESLSHECQKIGVSNICLLATLRSRCTLSEENLRRSIFSLVEKQPMLRSKIVRVNDQNFFQCDEANDTHFEVIQLDRNFKDIVSVTEEHLETSPCNDDGSLWKVFRLNEEYDRKSKEYINMIGIYVPHTMSDGRGVMILLHHLIKNLNSLDSQKAVDSGKDCGFPLLPSSASLLSDQIGWSRWQQFLGLPTIYAILLRSALQIYSWIPFSNPVLSHFHGNVQAEDNLKPATKLSVRLIPSEKAVKLLGVCKEAGYTVTGAIAAACHIALCSLLSERVENAKNDLTIAVSARADHSPQLPPEYISNSIAALNFSLPVTNDPNQFHTLAKYCTTKINDDINAKKHFSFVSLMEVADDLLFKQVLKESCKPLGERRVSGHSLSNIGKYVFHSEQNDTHYLENAWFVSASHRMFPTFANFVCTINDNINWATAYDGSVVSREIAQEYSNKAWEILEGFSETMSK